MKRTSMKATWWACAGMFAMGLIVSLAVWRWVPDPMPIHWDASGHPDGWMPKVVGLLFAPIFGLVLGGIVGLMTSRHRESRKVAPNVTLASSGFFLGLHVLIVRAALDPDAMISMSGVMSLVGLLFAAMGFVMTKVGPNPYVGVRLPWTMSDETNWKLTHRFARITFVAGGALVILTSMIFDPPLGFWIPFAALLIAALLPIAFSLAIRRKRA